MKNKSQNRVGKLTLTSITILIASIFVTGCGQKNTNLDKANDNSIVEYNTQTTCFANDLKEEIDDDIKISITVGESNKEINEISIDNLDDVMYGFEVHQRNKKGWITQQICRNNEAVTYDFLNTARSYYDSSANKPLSNKIISTGASGLENNNLTPGKYTLYIYTSPDKKNWVILGKRDFIVAK